MNAMVIRTSDLYRQIRIQMMNELPVQVDGEPWVQPAGHVVVLRSALKVNLSVRSWFFYELLSVPLTVRISAALTVARMCCTVRLSTSLKCRLLCPRNRRIKLNVATQSLAYISLTTHHSNLAPCVRTATVDHYNQSISVRIIECYGVV